MTAALQLYTLRSSRLILTYHIPSVLYEAPLHLSEENLNRQRR